MSSPTPIRHLFITLRRGLAGVREDHRAVITSLGLRRREQTVRRRNDASLRGAVEKVSARIVGCLCAVPA
jgi:ribosomal protein L30